MKGYLGTIATAICLLLSNQAAAATQYEAENATLSGGANRNTNHPGYTGTGFVDGYFNSATAQTSFAVSASFAGSNTITLRYSAGNGNSTNTGLYVNGTKIKNISFPGTANWDTWANKTETVSLNAGNNTIALKAETVSGSSINLDNLIAQATFSLTVFNDSHGGTSPSGTITVNAGTPTPISATPAPEYRFSNWTLVRGTATIANPNSANTTITLTSSNDTVRANFVPTLCVLTVTNDGAGGTTPTGSVGTTCGAATAISATPAPEFRFSSWTVVSGTATIANPSSANTTVTLTGVPATIRANFAPTLCVLTVTNDGGGTTTPTGSVGTTCGSPSSISATAATGFQFANWTVISGTAAIANPSSASTTVTLNGVPATIRANYTGGPANASGVAYAEISAPVTVTANNTVVLALPFTTTSSGHITVTVTGLYGSNSPYSDEQRGLESFVTLNSLSGGSLSGFSEKMNQSGSAQYVSETAGFQVAAGSNTVRLIVSPRTKLTATTYKFVKCKMTIVFSTKRL